MEELIKALQIFLKYKNVNYPTHCEHDTLYVVGYEKVEITEEDKAELDKLSFFFDEDDNCWKSYRYGSA